MVWIQPLVLTLQLMLVTVAIAAVLGIVGAWAASSLACHGRGKWLARWFLISMIAALAMPMILHAAAWEATAGKFGWLSLTQTGARSSRAYGYFGGLLACGWIHGAVGAAIVALATWFGTSTAAAPILGQSRLDAGPIAAWWRIRLPLAAPWLVASLLAAALLAATEMTVVDLYGYRSLADEFYLFYAVDPSPQSIVMTCCVPLAVVCGLLSGLLAWRQPLRAVRSADRVSAVDPAAGDPLPIGWQLLCGFLVLSLAGLIVIVPLAGLLIKAGQNVSVEQGQVRAVWSARACVERLWEAPVMFADEYRWTAIIAIVVGASAAAIAWPLAAVGRRRRRLERWIDVGTIVMVTLPGPIVALGVVSLFQAPLPAIRFLYLQTIVPTVLALLVRAVPAAYWVIRAGYRGIGTSVLDASRMDGAWARRVWSIERPLMQGSLLAAVAVAAVVASGDVPATLPVVPPGVATVGTRLFGLLHSGARYQEAVLALWYVAAVVTVSLISRRRHVSSLRRV